MNRTHHKRTYRALVVVVILSILVSMPAATCYAASGIMMFDQSTDVDVYSSVYGWDTSKMNATSWIGDNGQTIERQSLYRDKYFQDLVTTTKKYLGIKDNVGGGGNIAAVALAEYNLCEEEVAAGIYNNTQERNGDNNVKYNTWYYGTAVSGSSFPWCCVFVSWCANECGYLDNETLPAVSGRGYAGCTPLYRELTGTYGYESYSILSCYPYVSGGYEAVPGDLMFFYSGGVYDHIGIVVDVGEGGLVVVEGNSSNRVTKREYVLSYGSGSGENVETILSGHSYNARIVHVIYPDVSSVEGMFNYLTSAGYSNEAAAALIACMNYESMPWSNKDTPVDSEYYTELEDSGTYTNSQWRWYNSWELAYIYSTSNTSDGLPYGYGLFQWTDNLNSSLYSTRRTQMFNWVAENGYAYNHVNARTEGVSVQKALSQTYISLMGQLAWLDYDLQNNYKTSVYDYLMSSSDITQMVYRINYYYVGTGSATSTRQTNCVRWANEILSAYAG